MAENSLVDINRSRALSQDELWDKYGVASDGRPIYLSGAQKAILAATIASAYQTSTQIGAYQKTTDARFNQTDDALQHIIKQNDKLEAEAKTIEAQNAALATMLGIHHAQSMQAFENIAHRIDDVDANVSVVNQNVLTVASHLDKMEKLFDEYVMKDARDKALQRAETQVVGYRQQLEQKFGHYKQLRRTSIGLLQANDVGIVRSTSVASKSEDLMLQTPDYWLSPALVALSNWINDNQSISDRALAEALRRDRQSASLFFMLVTRRANRLDAAHRWMEYYFSLQNARDMDFKCIIVLNAFAAGLLGSHDNGKGISQLAEWLGQLNAESNNAGAWISLWQQKLLSMEAAADGDSYRFIRSFSSTWPVMDDVLDTASSARPIHDWLDEITHAQTSNADVKQQLDRLLSILVNDYVDQEMPLRKAEERCRIIIDTRGNEEAADVIMAFKEKAFNVRKNFGEMITEAAFDPEAAGASASTQQLSVSLMSPWITAAYRSILNLNRSKIPERISIDIDTFHDSTADGSDSDRLIENLVNHVNAEEREAYRASAMTPLSRGSLVGGPVCLLLAIILLLVGGLAHVPTATMCGFLLLAAGAGLLGYGIYAHSVMVKARAAMREHFTARRRDTILILRSLLKEISQWRDDLAVQDDNCTRTLQAIENLSPQSFIDSVADALEE